MAATWCAGDEAPRQLIRLRHRLRRTRWFTGHGDRRDPLVELVEAVQDGHTPVARFEAAVDAVVDGDVDALRAALTDDPSLVRARSTRRTHFDPPVHGAMQPATAVLLRRHGAGL